MSGFWTLEPDERNAIRRGVAQFNSGFFFECHDTLEEVWGGVRGEPRDFLQGLIQVSVAFYHLGRGNTEGARSLLERALKRLRKYPDSCYGFDVAAHRKELLAWLVRIRSGKLEAPPPTWVFEGPPIGA